MSRPILSGASENPRVSRNENNGISNRSFSARVLGATQHH